MTTGSPIKIIDPEFSSYILANAPLEELASGFRWTEGLVWMGDWGCLLFQDLPRDRTMRWTENGGVSVWRSPSANANGQARDCQGRVVFCSHLDRAVGRVEHDGSVTTLVSHCDGRRLNSPNDIIVKSDGTIWFTDPVYGISNDYEGLRQKSEPHLPSIVSTRPRTAYPPSQPRSKDRTGLPFRPTNRGFTSPRLATRQNRTRSRP